MIGNVSEKKAALLAGAGINSICNLAKLKGGIIDNKTTKTLSIVSVLSAIVAAEHSKAMAKKTLPLTYVLNTDTIFEEKYGLEKD